MPTRIEFVRPWGIYQPGQVVEYEHEGAADVLINSGTARPAGGVKPTTATTTAVSGPPSAGGPPKPTPKKPKGQ